VESLSELTCTTQGGNFIGANTTCADCPPTVAGACCLSDGTCAVLSETRCGARGGAFQGPKSVCADDDADGVPNCFDICSGTPDGDAVDLEGCALINCDPGGPYSAVCDGGIVEIHLVGSVTGQLPPPAGPANLVSDWTTTCPGVTFGDVTNPVTTLTIDTSLTGCPLACDISLTCMFVPVNQGGGALAATGPIIGPVTVTTQISLFLDCNGNQTDDVVDIVNGTSRDCDGNGVPDECEAPMVDCNGNAIPDACDINPIDPDGNGLVSSDCDGNGVPDECELPTDDCNGNGILDRCEADCNGNGVPDDCDIDAGDPDGNGSVSDDCNGNGIPDECDVNPADPDGDGNVSFDVVSPDNDGDGQPDPTPDGVPDECQVGVPFFACCLPSGDCAQIDSNDLNACVALGGTPQPFGTSCGSANCGVAGCDPNEPSVSVLFSALFRAPVCGIGCPTIVLATFVGMVSLRGRYRRRRRRRHD